jgi:hypothetical protein
VIERAVVLAMAVVAAAPSAVGCGGITSGGGRDAGPDSPGSDDAARDATRSDGGPDETAPAEDSTSPQDSAVGPCPAVYSVYGDMDASDNLGGVNPTLYASGTCGGATEQFSGVDAGTDASFGSTDLKVTLQQSSLRSGMFVTKIHQTTPFPFDLTTCLQSAGHGTGSKPGACMPGTLALVNDPEMPMFPQVQLGTNFGGTNPLFDVALSDHASFGLGDVSCTFVEN